MNSSGAPHHAQIVSPCSPFALKCFLTAIHPDTSWNKKCFILGGYCTFQQKAFSGETERPYSGSILSLSGYNHSTWYSDLTMYLPLLVKCQPSWSAVWIRLNSIHSIIFTYWGSTRVRMTYNFHVLSVTLMRESTCKAHVKIVFDFYLLISGEWMEASDHFILR